MSKTANNTLNGLDTEAMAATVRAIQDEAIIAKFQFRAENHWLGGGHNRTTIRDFDGACQRHEHAEPHVLESDEPQVLLGNDAAVNPAAHALHALAACLCSSLVIHATARGIQVRSVESTLEGDVDLHGLLGLNPEIRNGFQNVRVGLRVDADAPSEVIDELIEVAQARSPLADALANPTPLSVRRLQ
ncbi:MAG: OsmC family protein [Myxococcales bacterium]|nr:OsmC family protein [Myxococcales bacterium]